MIIETLIADGNSTFYDSGKYFMVGQKKIHFMNLEVWLTITEQQGRRQRVRFMLAALGSLYTWLGILSCTRYNTRFNYQRLSNQISSKIELTLDSVYEVMTWHAYEVMAMKIIYVIVPTAQPKVKSSTISILVGMELHWTRVGHIPSWI